MCIFGGRSMGQTTHGFSTDCVGGLVSALRNAKGWCMPKSRGRRPRRSQKSGRDHRRTSTPRVSPELRAQAVADFPVLRAVDAAEAEGDARKALTLIERDLDRRGPEKTFWHPDRLERLVQLVVNAPVLPGWASSRWILAQAVRWMDSSQRARFTRAFDRTVEVTGWPERSAGVDELDSQCKLVDHDWVYRQLVLFECGGLRHFLDRLASPRLVGRADGIREWADAPMGAYRYVDEEPQTMRWFDLVSGREVET